MILLFCCIMNYKLYLHSPHSQHNPGPGVWVGFSCGKPGRQTCDLAIRSSHRVVPRRCSKACGVYGGAGPAAPSRGAPSLRCVAACHGATNWPGQHLGSPHPLFPPISDIRFLGRRVRRDSL